MPNRIVSERKRTGARSGATQFRVLVTEDNIALRQLMADVLEYEGYCVTEAANAFEMQSAILQSGSERASNTPFDLIVSDVSMPGKSGLEALSELRQSGLRSRFLVVTSFPEVVTYHQIEKLDVSLLEKPFSLKEFRTMATAMLKLPIPDSASTP
ncbi:MAG TPA: response regulator [Polyangiaceae bacterium]|nr:response regulator [Polyangiaceae bacterium]